MKANDKVDELDQLLILAKKSELAVLVKLYAEKNPLFRKEVTRYLDAKYKSAATTSNYRKAHERGLQADNCLRHLLPPS